MKERPILFSGPMVQAIIDGRKDQTRRVVKWPRGLMPLVPDWDHDRTRVDPGGTIFGPGPYLKVCAHHPEEPRDDDHDTVHRVHCPYDYPEDGARLWVREAWRAGKYWDDHKPSDIADAADIWYEADGRKDGLDRTHWGRLRPGMYMPRWASRLTLFVKAVRVERLQEISEADAIAEGAMNHNRARYWDPSRNIEVPPHVHGYISLWESINGPGTWAANPWVWVIQFERVKP